PSHVLDEALVALAQSIAQKVQGLDRVDLADRLDRGDPGGVRVREVAGFEHAPEPIKSVREDQALDRFGGLFADLGLVAAQRLAERREAALEPQDSERASDLATDGDVTGGVHSLERGDHWIGANALEATDDLDP